MSGTVLSTRYNDEWGTTQCLLKEDRGFKLWGTVPRAIVADADRGTHIRFIARIERSDQDDFFGFFRRPTKAEIA